MENLDEDEYGSCPSCGASVHTSEMGNEGGVVCCQHCFQQVREDQNMEQMKKLCLTIAFDFDGVLAEYDGWKGWEHTGKPIAGMSDLLHKLHEAGHTIIIFTTRGKDQIVDWCDRYGIYVDFINRNPAIQGSNPGKPIADVYIDDRGLQFDPSDLATLEERIVNFAAWWEREE